MSLGQVELKVCLGSDNCSSDEVTMFPNMLAPSPLYQGLFRAPTVPGLAHPQPMSPAAAAAAAAASTSFLVENLLRERSQQIPPGLIVTSPHQAALLSRGIHPSLMRYPPTSPRSRSPSPSPPASRLSPQSTTTPATVSSHRDSTSSSSKHSSPPPSLQQDAPAHGRTPSPGPAGSHPAVNPPASAPFLKFGVNAILSSQISPKNGK